MSFHFGCMIQHMTSPTGVLLVFLGWPRQTSVQELQNQPNELDHKTQVKFTWNKVVVNYFTKTFFLTVNFCYVSWNRWNFIAYLFLMHRQLSQLNTFDLWSDQTCIVQEWTKHEQITCIHCLALFRCAHHAPVLPRLATWLRRPRSGPCLEL